VNGQPLILKPACYTRGLTDDASIRQAWVDGKDFQLANGQYCSVRDLHVLMSGTSTLWLYNPTAGKAFRIL